MWSMSMDCPWHHGLDLVTSSLKTQRLRMVKAKARDLKKHQTKHAEHGQLGSTLIQHLGFPLSTTISRDDAHPHHNMSTLWKEPGVPNCKALPGYKIGTCQCWIRSTWWQCSLGYHWFFGLCHQAWALIPSAKDGWDAPWLMPTLD